MALRGRSAGSAATLLALTGLLAYRGAAAEELVADAALESDDQCAADDDPDCALNAVQLRARRKVAAVPSPSLCSSYGCHASYDRAYSCQCNSQCTHYNNCCGDYSTLCAASSEPAPASPSASPSAPAPAHAPAPVPNGNLPHGHPSSSTSYPQHDGFTLWLVEEFDSPIDLDSDPIWTWSDGGLIEGQVRFVKEAITFEGGKMKITAAHNNGASVQSCSNAEVATIKPKPMTSGEVRTRYNWFRYGRYEARIRAPTPVANSPSTDGSFVSTMFVYRDAKFHTWREIDFEITGDSIGSVTTNVLRADNTTRWRDGIQESVHHDLDSTLNARSDFHTYAFEWLPDRVTWFIDGVQIREFKGGHLPVPELSGKIMMNLWLFDDRALFGGPHMTNNQYPIHSEYDWFRFYKYDGDSSYPCASLDSSCLSSSDLYLTSNNPCDGIPQQGTVNGHQPCHSSCH